MSRSSNHNTDSRRYNDWLFHAFEDYLAADVLHKEEKLQSICVFHCQQCFEKSLKAFLLYKKTAGASLVVCPASVVMNWRSELARFAPSLNVYVLNSEANRKEVIDNAAEGDVVLSSYGLLAYEDQALLSKDWNVVCLDEAHTIKNRQTRTSASAMQLRAGSRIILTGTPVQNYLGELWNLMQFLNPGLLGTFESFRTRYMGEGDNIENLKRIVQPFVLRRTKAEVLSELPDTLS